MIKKDFYYKILNQYPKITKINLVNFSKNIKKI